MKSADGRFQYLDINEDPCPPGTPPAQVHYFAYVCRACKKADNNTRSTCPLNLGGRGHDRDKKNWHWDGNVDQPTIHPSVDCQGCWHGFIVAGVFQNTAHQPEPMQ